MKKFCGYCGSAMKTANQEEAKSTTDTNIGQETLELDSKVFSILAKGRPILLFGDEDYHNNASLGITNLKNNLNHVTNTSYLSKVKKHLKLMPQKAVDIADKKEKTRKEEEASTIAILIKAEDDGELNLNLIKRFVDRNNLVFLPEKGVITKDKYAPIRVSKRGKNDESIGCHAVVLSIRPEKNNA